MANEVVKYGGIESCELKRRRRSWENGAETKWNCANAVVLYPSSWPLSAEPAEQEARPYKRCGISRWFKAGGVIILGSDCKGWLWHACRAENDAPWERQYNIKHSEAFARRARTQGEENGIWFQTFNASGAEKYCMDDEDHAEVYLAG